MTIDRRTLLHATLVSPFALGLRRLVAAAQAPAIVTAESARPRMTGGVASGDPSGGRGIVWSRTDRPSRMLVELSTTESFSSPMRLEGSAALPETGFTARLDVPGLPPGQRVFYRVRFRDLGEGKALSEPLLGSFHTAPSGRRDVTFAWGADTVGQGWGIDPARGGMTIYESMRKAGLDFFVHCGDTIYADNPLVAERTLDDGTIWRNLVTEEKSKVAETLDEFRGNFAYNLLDDNLRAFNAEVPTIALWDDHEVINNWDSTKVLLDDARYKVKSVALLAARAKKAFLEFMPTRPAEGDSERIHRSCRYGPSLEVFALDERSYRGANSRNRQMGGEDAAFLGAAQLAWLKEALLRSTARWKVIASDMPLGLAIQDGDNYEAWSNGDAGLPLGRELEIADLLSFLKRSKVRNVVFITGDVHYGAAYHYHPDRAAFKDFEPFWEFVGGPLHAGTFLPTPLDPTFGPEARFVAVPSTMKQNRPPSEGLQFFGKIRIDGKTEVLTVTLHDRDGAKVYELSLPPRAA